MSAKIAVFTHDLCRADPSLTSVTAMVLEKSGGAWGENSKHYVNIKPGAGVTAVRQALDTLVDQLGDCRIAAGPGMTGVLYRALDSHGFSVFETTDLGPETLDGILSDLDTEDGGAQAPETPVCPTETGVPGVYALDLLRLQEHFPELSSKQALREFLETVPFLELRLTCGHVPPWLEAGPYDVTAGEEGGAVVAVIRKRICGGGDGDL